MKRHYGLVILLGGLTAACVIPADERCPEGYTLSSGACRLITVSLVPDQGTDPVGDMTVTTPDDGSDMGQVEVDMAGPNVPFGDTCTSDAHTDCSGETDFCNKQPGMTEGYCSAMGCDVDASICPETWSCFNLGQFDPELPWVCVR